MVELTNLQRESRYQELMLSIGSQFNQFQTYMQQKKIFYKS